MAIRKPKKKQIVAAMESDEPQVVLGPCSIKQQQVLLDDQTDILLVGGGSRCLHVKNNSLIAGNSRRDNQQRSLVS